MLEFQKLQAQLTAHIRNPALAAAPGGIEDRRLNIYRELFYNNIEGFLANAFPVVRHRNRQLRGAGQNRLLRRSIAPVAAARGRLIIEMLIQFHIRNAF